jgi:hypothetical protein
MRDLKEQAVESYGLWFSCRQRLLRQGSLEMSACCKLVRLAPYQGGRK